MPVINQCRAVILGLGTAMARSGESCRGAPCEPPARVCNSRAQEVLVLMTRCHEGIVCSSQEADATTVTQAALCALLCVTGCTNRGTEGRAHDAVWCEVDLQQEVEGWSCCGGVCKPTCPLAASGRPG